MGPESYAESVLTQLVRALGGLSIKLMPTRQGMPDRLIVLPGGRFYFVEMKSAVGRASLSQKHMHSVLEKLGAPVVILLGAPDVREWIRALTDDEFEKSASL